MTQPERGPVVIDTGVFGARLTRGTKSLAAAYRPLRDGRPAIISFVTVAELRFGAKLAGWVKRGSSSWSTNLIRPTPYGRDRASPRPTPHCVPGASRPDTAWGKSPRSRPLGGRDSHLAQRSARRARRDLRQCQGPSPAYQARSASAVIESCSVPSLFRQTPIRTAKRRQRVRSESAGQAYISRSADHRRKFELYFDV